MSATKKIQARLASGSSGTTRQNRSRATQPRNMAALNTHDAYPAILIGGRKLAIVFQNLVRVASASIFLAFITGSRNVENEKGQCNGLSCPEKKTSQRTALVVELRAGPTQSSIHYVWSRPALGETG